MRRCHEIERNHQSWMVHCRRECVLRHLERLLLPLEDITQEEEAITKSLACEKVFTTS